MSQDAKIDKLVLEYLEKRGLVATSKQLKQESQPLAQQMTLAPGKSDRGTVSDLLYYIAADGKPQQYGISFDYFVEWVDNSLDLYKYELSQLLYPVFIHCCLSLVGHEAVSQATQLNGRYVQRFTSIGNHNSKVRMQELNELQAVTLPEHLATSRLAQAVRKVRYPVKLCAYSHELLMHFLQASRLFLILGIVNDHISIQVEEGQPKPMPAVAEKEMSLLSGQLEAGSDTAVLSELNLNLLQGSAEDVAAAMRAAREAEAIPDEDETGKPLTKKERAVLQRAAVKQKEALAAIEGRRMEAEVPLPQASEEEAEARVADVQARLSLSAARLPSAAFFTFVNTHHALNCVAISAAADLLAGGYADGSVRVYDTQTAGSQTAEKAADEEAAVGRSQTLYGHSGQVYGVDLSPPADLLFSASADGSCRLWHLELSACLNSYREHNYPVWDVSCCPYGHYFASAAADHTARVWSVERNQSLRILAGHYSDVGIVRWHPNAHYLATGSSDHTLRLWDLRDGAAKRVLIGHRAAITALAFHPEGSLLSSADEDGVIISWDLAQGKRLASGEKHKNAVWCLAYSSGAGELLASGGADHTLRLWDSSPQPTEQKQLPFLKSFRTKSSPVFAARFTSRNLLLAAGAFTRARKLD